MTIFEEPIYKDDLNYLTSLDIPWEMLKDKTVLVSGGTGMIGSCLVDVLLYKNRQYDLNCHVIILGRSEEKAKCRFNYCWDSEYFRFITCELNSCIDKAAFPPLDYVVHLASTTHPVAYATEPIDTIMTNILGTQTMLELAKNGGAQRFVFASSNEIYGENRGDVELFDESYCGYINCNTLRAGYTEGKRCGEALCQAYIKQYGMNAVIARFTRSYGPTLLPSDTKALSQFLRNGLCHEDIVLKSEGRQYFSYTYMADAVAGLLFVMLKGKCGEAYNIADVNSDITLRDLAQLIAEKSGTKVVFDLPDDIESVGFSKVTKARLNGEKIKALGWQMHYNIEEGISRTMNVLEKIQF